MAAFETDVLVLGAGAAGLFCAIEAGKRGRKVIVLEKAAKPAQKIRISGGGRCNFTNTGAGPANYVSANPKFAISALSRYTPAHFIELVQRHGIAFHEKKLGQLFCDGSSQNIIGLLVEECRRANVQMHCGINIQAVQQGFRAETSIGEFASESLVIATGGISIPKMGATGFGYEIAKQFGLEIVPTDPALVPFTFNVADAATWPELAGVSVSARVTCGKQSFDENVLFTHRGLSGPAILQASLYWTAGKSRVEIDFYPGQQLSDALIAAKRSRPNTTLSSTLSAMLPKRFAQRIGSDKLLGAFSDHELNQLAASLHRWRFIPGGTEGYRTAEVTRGGVSTRELSSQTMEARRVPGLFFIGEVVDVTGQLGGYNFQWAWSSAFAAGQSC